MKHKTLWLMAFVLAWTVPTLVAEAAYQWLDHNGHQYARTESAKTWVDAELEAVAAGGHLVTINDQAEDDWVYQTYVKWEPGRFWIGLWQNPNDPLYAEPAGGWVWVSGEPVTYTNWQPGEPNGIPPSDNWAAMTGPQGAPPQGWNDVGISLEWAVIERIPEPATLSLLALGGLALTRRRR